MLIPKMLFSSIGHWDLVIGHFQLMGRTPHARLATNAIANLSRVLPDFLPVLLA
jgi:hypothetical protein